MAVGFYFAAYFARASRLGGGDNIGMAYDYQLQAEIFKPAAFIESLVTRKHVFISKRIPNLNKSQ
jgi:hypothetical protein